MSKIPKLRFKEFSGSWKEKRLKDVTTYIDYRGRAPIKTEKGNFLVTAKNIKKGFIDYKCSKEYVSEDNYLNVMSKGLPEIGDILFTTEAPMGNVAQVDNKNIALAQRVIKFRSKEMLLNFYLLHYMLSPIYQNTISKKSIGTTVQGISGKELHKTKVSFPSLDEQEKIASFLTSIDIKIEQLTKKETLLKEYKKGVMQKIFNQEIRFKDDEGSDFSNWEEIKLNDIAIKKTEKNRDNSINSVLTNSAKFGIVNQKDYFDKDIANQNNLEGYYVVEKDDFIYNPRISSFAPVGPMKRNKLERGIMSPLYTVLEFKKVYRDFYEYYFSTTLWHRYMNQIANYGARHDRMNITSNDLMKMTLSLPCEREQVKIVEFLSSLDKKLEHAQKQLEQTKEFKKALLQQMFV